MLVEEKILSTFQSKLHELECVNDKFWCELEKIKFELYDYKNEVECLINELSINNYKSNDKNNYSKIENLDISKKLNEEGNSGNSLIINHTSNHSSSKITLMKWNNKIESRLLKNSVNKQLDKSEKSISLKNNYNTENKFIDLDVKLSEIYKKGDRRSRISNSHSPQTKTKMTIKLDSQINTLKNSKKSKENTSIVNNKFKSVVKFDNSGYRKTSNKIKNNNLKITSLSSTKKDTPINIIEFSNLINSSKESYYKINDTNGKKKIQLPNNKKTEDQHPQQIEIYLTDEIGNDTLDNKNYGHFDNNHNIIIDIKEDIFDNI